MDSQCESQSRSSQFDSNLPSSLRQRSESNPASSTRLLSESNLASSTRSSSLSQSSLSSSQPNLSLQELQSNALVLFIQMAYCGRRTLNHYLQDPAREVKEEEVLQVCVQLCGALQHIHSKHVIHRDVKPANIFYSEDGTLRLGDFGLSRDLSDPADGEAAEAGKRRSVDSATTTNIGTLIYSSPEQFSLKGSYDYKSDIYAAGMVLYEMTFPAFKTMSERYIVLGEPRSGKMPAARPGISADTFALIRKMLSLDPQQRPSAEEARETAKLILEHKHKLIIQLSQEKSFSE